MATAPWPRTPASNWGNCYAQRKDFKPALELFNDVLDKEPPPDLTDKVRIRIGEIYTLQGNLKGALAHFEAVAQNPKSAMFGQAQYGAAEVNLASKQLPEAIKRLSLFFSQPNLQNQPGVTDRALLRLGQAQAEVKNWDESRKAFNQVVNAFPGSGWVEEARYGLGFALQQQRQLDQALNTYAQVTGRTATVVAAKAQLQIGLCKLEQKKYAEAVTAFMVVPTTYGYPELSAAALLEAAGAHTVAKSTEGVDSSIGEGDPRVPRQRLGQGRGGKTEEGNGQKMTICGGYVVTISARFSLEKVKEKECPPTR